MSAEDAEFDAFLQGEGDLARRLQAMPQPSPSASLDAAILGKISQSMAPTVRAAANDPGETPTPQLARGLGLRWRVPAGIAATVLVGLFAKQSFDTSVGNVQAPAMASKPHADVMIVADESAAPPSPAPPPEVSPQLAAPPTARPRAAMPRKAQVEQAVAADEVQAPVAAAAPAPAPSAGNEVSRKAALAAEPDGAADAIAHIEKLLAEGDQAGALRNWTRFRERYPQHVVSPDLDAKMKALSQP